MKITSILSHIPFKKYISGFLVTAILISQTIHVDFFDSVLAGPENYRDIVSIVVDKDTYGSERNRILRYAEDISGYLGGVRTTIMVVDPKTPVSIISQKNEKLYYEGDAEDGVSALVGTILIGNIPVPLVTKDGKTFPSVYPYVDFVDKSFVFESKTSRYNYNNQANSESVEVWHGIINPAVGRNWAGTSDVTKIANFLDKTHQFYTKSGKFVPSNIPPKVLYYDGLLESKSMDSRGLFQYSLSMKNAENIAYNRFTKYLLRDISANLQVFDAQTADPDITALYASLGISPGSDTLSDEQIKKLPDIQSRDVILGFLKNFKQIFNEKSLGDELLAVHNAGRYTNGATVRADIAPVSISLMDDIARATLKTSNQALADAIDNSLKNSIATKLVIFDKNSMTVPAAGYIETHKKEYKNYFFGTPAESVTTPSQCTIARGFSGDVSNQGRSVLVEANAAFDIKSTQGHIDILKNDTEQLVNMHRNANYSCFNTSNNTAKLLSYWGDNSILKMMNGSNSGASGDSFLFEASPATTFKGFSLPIFSLGGMKESSRISNPSIANCIDNTYQYSLLQPYLRTYNDDDGFRTTRYTIAWPDEWNQGGRYNGGAAPRFTCNTAHQVTTSISFASSLQEYSSRTCFAGTLYLDNQPFKTINNSCIDTLGSGDASYQVDNTTYEDRYYHSISSVWSHVSPTETEIAAAKANGVTPSLAIDHIRFVEFLTPKGNIARINYPNFFALEGNDVASARAWITKISTEQWKAVLDKENATSLSPDRSLINQHVSPGTLPNSPIDWNTYISDEMIEKIIQAKNWLHPDISKKYKKAIESMLSYSHVNASVTPFTESAPEIPSLSDEYEIAFLGLPNSFSADFSVGSSSAIKDGYDTKIREIEGANITEESQDDFANNYNSSTQCGPPDGVPLAQWPSAIMCWIKEQFPPKIINGSCGPSTIGLETPQYVNVEYPSSDIANNTTLINTFYAGSRIVPHLKRSSLQLTDSTSIDLSLQKNDKIIGVLPDTNAYLEVKKITVNGKNVAIENFGDYIEIAPNSVLVGEKGAQFVINSKGKEADVTLAAYYELNMPDGNQLKISSSEFGVRITPEYYDIALFQSGNLITSIDVTASLSTQLKVEKILKDGNRSELNAPVKIEIFDDISGQIVYSGSSFNPKITDLPIDITKKIGVYRLILTDTAGIVGEITFAVQSGEFSQVRIVPISSALVKGSTTIAMIRLLDRLGNPISPDLHSVKISVAGGYIVDSNGEKKSSIIQDLMESQIPVVVGSNNAGNLSIEAIVDDTIKSTKDITIHATARIALFRNSDPKVGGDKVPVRIEIQDANGQRIPGFSSVATLSLPSGAGSFSEESITITDGQSASFEYTPGTVSGNHMLNIDVPGVGSLSNIAFSLQSGDPMYVDHLKDENGIVFSLRDRYGNIADRGSFVGTLVYNADAPRSISFVNGIYTTPLNGGQYTINVPGLKNSKIEYTDDSGTQVINGIDIYTVFIAGKQEKLDFAPDYNARYTVLAGGSFLREGEDILYNTTPGQSQSLAVTTILDSPSREDVLFSIFPGGSYEVNEGIYDTALESSISLSENYPLLTITDLVTRKQVARVLYKMDNVAFEVCRDLGNSNCSTPKTSPTIRVTLPENSDLTIENSSDSIAIKSSNANILNIKKDGSIQSNSSVSFVAKNTSSIGFEFGLMFNGSEVATLTYITNNTVSVSRNATVIEKNTPTLLNSGYSISSLTQNSNSPNTLGYKIYKSSSAVELDETKSGPNGIDSIGSLEELPGVGWQGNNTMMLAYAGGDTVGEATRFFHTYTLVNLGDPMTHVDHGRPGTEIDGIDRTVGSIVARTNGAGIANFFHRDMNADAIEDLIVAYQDGYIELLLNHRGKFRSRGMIAYNKDIDAKQIVFGDFLGDGFGDILGINKDGDFILVDNSNRKFVRTDISLSDGSVVPRHISQFKIYDMDADKKDDIVYITASGELGILYGTDSVGVFSRKILDPTLGITLSKDPITTGGAIKTSNIINIAGPVGVSPASSTTLDDSMLKGEVYYQYSRPTPVESVVNVDPSALSGVLNNIANGAEGSRMDTFVRSQYAPAFGLDIQKVYTNTTHPTLYPDDIIRAKITIKNTSNAVIRNIEYLDSIPKIFSLEKTDSYSVTVGGTTVNRVSDRLSSGDYDLYFNGRDLAPGETMEITYDLIALPASYGEMIVDDLEKNTPGADNYGDVGFKTSTTCGASMLLWVSGPNSRDYNRTTHEFGAADLPDGLASRLEDKDNNKIPDSIENMSPSDKEKAYNDISNSQITTQPIVRVNQNGGQMTLGFDDSSVDSIIDATQNLLDGLSCGFGGGSCLNFPLNWAPLAPGSSPSLFGIPLNIQGMTPSSGLPIFSGLTGFQMMCGTVPCCIPTVYPVSPLGYVPGPACGAPSAGGMLGTWAPTNFMRVYVTPTLTLGMGTAICMGGPASAMGQIPPPGLSPLIQGGNCIVVAKAMPFCKGDGSSADGDVTEISGLGSVGGDTWNATSCKPEANTITEEENKELTNGIIGYLKNPNTTRLNDMYTLLSKRGNQGFPNQSLLRIGGGASSGGSEIGIEIDSNTKISDIGSVIKLKNKRVASFPDFMMDWLTRQTEEITTSLFTPPSLTVTPPTSFGQNAQVDSSYKDFANKLNDAYSQTTLDNIKQGVVNAKPANTKNVPDSLKGTLGSAKGTLNSIKSAYNTIGKLPFISIKQSTIPLNIPWVDKRELDKYERTLKSYKDEIDAFQQKMCINDTSAACLEKKGRLSSGPFVSSVLANLKRVEEYRKFPTTIMKYITWKERYIAQVLCNINIIQQITGGWIRDNGIRFRKWAELYVLIRAIADGWQPILDIFADTSKNCGVCRNERNNLQYWKFKLLSMLIPSIPVIKFPKWPDILLDLSDVRLGISISLPNFDPRISPIRLPNLPSLALGDLSAGVSLPGFMVLPGIPGLPDLPDLPSLPKVKLPDLPPPPKLPKIAGSITAFLKIMKLISKMYCFYQKTFLVPEWQAGDIIAQRTERQGTLPFDFLNLSFPQFSLPTLKNINVGSHVNYNLRSEFITEFSRAAVKPVNQFQTDLNLAMPTKVGNDVGVQGVDVTVKPKLPFNINEVDQEINILAAITQEFERDKDVFMDVDEFALYMLSELEGSELKVQRDALKKQLARAAIDAKKVENDLFAHNEEKFNLLKEYVSSQDDDIAQLQSIVDLMNSGVSGDIRPLISQNIAQAESSNQLLEKFNRLQSATDSSTDSMGDMGLSQARSGLESKLSRMVAANTNSQGATPDIAEGYSPRYQGIYILTPTGIQTQLFDYISPLTEDTRVSTVDIDQDGDLDYIYLLDGVLYVKYSWAKVPNKIQDNSVKVISVNSSDYAPYVPDYFHENLSSPKNLNYSFVPAYQEETEWRVEFFDRYLEWDAVDIGDHNEAQVPRSIIDMFVDIDAVPTSVKTLRSIPTRRSLMSVKDADSFIIQGRSIEVFTGALSISLSPGRILYTGKDRVSIIYKNQTNPVLQKTILEPYTGYEFDEITEISTTNGKLFLIGQEDSSLYQYSDDLIGVPILPGMRIYASDAGSLIRDHTSSTTIDLGASVTYITSDLGKKSTQYEVSFPYINGYYYARLNNLTLNRNDRAGVILFAPQASSDDGAPIIDLPTTIRLPIYSQKTYQISEILTDLSKAEISIDSDLTKDTDNNGIPDDDFGQSGTGFRINNNELIFGSFVSPGKYNMSLKAVDEVGNISIMPLVIEAYALIPQIKDVDGIGKVTGSIPEMIENTPIHLFRVRPGEGPVLIDKNSTPTTATGIFTTSPLFNSGEIIRLNTAASGIIMNNRGIFTLPSGYRIDIVPASTKNPMQILTLNASGSILHTHTLQLPDNTNIIDTSKNANSLSGVLLTPVNGITRVIPANSTDTSIPGGMYITDESYKPIIAIARDGNIYRLDVTTTLKYRFGTNYLTFDIIRGNSVIGTIEYRIDFFYTMK